MRPRLWLPDISIEKAPDGVRTYTINFIRELQTDTISTITVVPDDATTLQVDSSSFSGADVTFTLSGGTDGDKTFITVTLNTSSGQTLPRIIDVNIKDL